jgi:hypothetical protein
MEGPVNADLGDDRHEPDLERTNAVAGATPTKAKRQRFFHGGVPNSAK